MGAGGVARKVRVRSGPSPIWVVMVQAPSAKLNAKIPESAPNLPILNRSPMALALQNAAPNLVQFDAFKQGFEIAFAKALVSFSLDKLKKDRPHGILAKDLQQ